MKYRHTKIIFTVGPASESEEMLRQLIVAGGNVCRINMAHATHPWCRELVGRVREISLELDQPVALMMDIKGPEVRTGPLSEPIKLRRGDLLAVRAEGTEPEGADRPGERVLSTNYPGLVNDIGVGDRLLIDNGMIELEVLERDGASLHCRALNEGILGSRRHINLPGITTSLPSFTQKDREDATLGIELGVHYYAMSFVRQADDIDLLRRFLSENDNGARIIAKIEDQSAIENLKEIIQAADGLMVARGDLGIEVPFERLPIIQRQAVNLCLEMGCPVIIATHLLESMISSPVPTRAEITDVANGVSERADCLMLSGETTIGKHPVRCVEILDRTIQSIEGSIESEHNDGLMLKTSKAKILRSAVVLAEDLGGAGIIVFTRNGYLARILSLLRPLRSPIYAFTDEKVVFHQMSLLWGVTPVFMSLNHDPEIVIEEAFSLLLSREAVVAGDQLVVISNVLLKEEILDTVQLRTVGSLD
ncbi:pyruvate kinase [bacterium]|jgi:pyruvate kinase|nr:pyruvate kinase [Verrucomicrobiota bacterium]MDB4796801.1 pyruvate kinase [bacterium]